jgi:chromosome segregation ATPase
MPRFINVWGSRVLRTAGLERSGKTAELRAALARSEQRLVELKHLVEQTRGEVQTWKSKLHEATAHYERQRQSEREQYEARTTKLEERAQRAAAKLAERDAARQEKLAELRDKVVAADRSVRIGRDHLMAIEVKLDVIEGAVNVLDRRYRTIARPADQLPKRTL